MGIKEGNMAYSSLKMEIKLLFTKIEEKRLFIKKTLHGY